MKKKQHKCDGGDDYGLIDCLKCEQEMLKAFNRIPKDKKRAKIRETFSGSQRWRGNPQSD